MRIVDGAVVDYVVAFIYGVAEPNNVPNRVPSRCYISRSSYSNPFHFFGGYT
jgi:hypothetical protein